MCLNPFTGTTCNDLQSSTISLPATFNLPSYQRVYAYFNSTNIGTENLLFSLQASSNGDVLVCYS
jgi:hypothetical protein